MMDSASNCFRDVDTQTHSVAESIGYDYGTATDVLGLLTCRLQQQSTFEGWDFIDVWDTDEGRTYPLLRTHSAGDVNKDRIANFLDVCVVGEHWMEEE